MKVKRFKFGWSATTAATARSGGRSPSPRERRAGHGTHVETRFPAARKIGNNAPRRGASFFARQAALSLSAGQKGDLSLS
jgi:hypothetical protein